MPVTSIANQKGGVGKTTTAIHLASAYAMAGKKSLLIDIDPQGNATSGLGVQSVANGGISRLLGRGEAVPQPLSPYLSIIPNDSGLSQIEKNLHTSPDRFLRLKNAIEPFLNQFDEILIDCPPSSGMLPQNALLASQKVIIPIQAEYFAMEGLTQILQSIVTISQVNPGLKAEGILFTLVDPMIDHSRAVIQEVKSHYQRLVYKPVIMKDISFSESSSYGKSIFDYAPRSLGAKCYIDFAWEVIHGQKAG